MKKPLTNSPYVPYREPPTCPELSLDPPTEPNLKVPVEPDEPERKHRKRPPTPHKRRRAARDGSNRHRRTTTPGQLVARLAIVGAICLTAVTPVWMWLSSAPPPAPVVPAVAPIGPVTAPLTDEPTSRSRVPRATGVTKAPKRLIVPTTTLTRKKVVPRTTTSEEE